MPVWLIILKKYCFSAKWSWWIKYLTSKIHNYVSVFPTLACLTLPARPDRLENSVGKGKSSCDLQMRSQTTDLSSVSSMRLWVHHALCNSSKFSYSNLNGFTLLSDVSVQKTQVLNLRNMFDTVQQLKKRKKKVIDQVRVGFQVPCSTFSTLTPSQKTSHFRVNDSYVV